MFKTFKRSYHKTKPNSYGRKMTEETGLTETQALQRCETFNNNRNSRQIARGTKLEYMKMS